MIVRESINFERGQDPKRSLHLGVAEFLQNMEKEFKMYYPGLMPPKEFFERSETEGDGDVFCANVNSMSPYWTKICKEFFKEDPYFEFISLKKRKQWEYILKVKFNPNKKITESVNFERGIDPKKSVGIGLESPKRFHNIEEFTNHIIAALPLIFGGKIPEDILSKQEGGMLPESYYGKIAWWLSEKGFEMPNGSSDWESHIEQSPTEFKYWATPLVKKLEQILGEKRWKEYD